VKKSFSVNRIKHQSEYAEWLLKKHYARRIPSISYAYGLYDNNCLKGVCTFGTPSSSTLRGGVAGEEYSFSVIELNRLCVDAEEINITSWFVSKCLRSFDHKIIISYADTKQGHIGKIYQATNFIYTGLSAKRTDWKVKGFEHLHGQTISDESRGQPNRAEYMRNKYGEDFYLKERSRKHRYIYICGNKTFKKKVIKALNYEVCEYPKGETKRYDASFKPISQMLMEF
jgi:hypothetical protein